MMQYLKCDATGCDHVENVGEITEGHIDMPCPKCGASLLTHHDWKVWRRVQWVIKTLKFLRLLKEYHPGDPIPEGKKLMNVRIHNNKAIITEEEPT